MGPNTPTAIKNDSGSTVASETFFKGHQLPVKNLNDRKVPKKSFDGFFSIVLLLAFILFILARIFSPRKFSQFFTAFLKPRVMGQLLREEYAFTNRTTILLLVLYALVISLFGFQLAVYFTDHNFLQGLNDPKPAFVFLGLLGFISGTYIIKIVVIRLMAFTFGLRAAGSEYIYTILLFNKIAGLFLFPVVLLLAFARQLDPVIPVYSGLLFLGILLVYRILRLVQIGMAAPGVSVLYLFLYLCTLEILPFVVLIKLFVLSFS